MAEPKKGCVWKTAKEGLCMQRCPQCELENWIPAVATGKCAWCGYAAKDEDANG